MIGKIKKVDISKTVQPGLGRCGESLYVRIPRLKYVFLEKIEEFSVTSNLEQKPR